MLIIFASIIIVVGLILLIIGIIDGNRFVVAYERIKVDYLKKDCRIVMISDLHAKVYGKSNESIVQQVRKANPDMIVIAGDLITSKVWATDDAGVELINTLREDYPIYYAHGNHESKLQCKTEEFGDRYRRLMTAIEHENVHVLVNDWVMLPEYNMCMYGLDMEKEYYARFRKAELPQVYMSKAVGCVKEKMCNVLIAHNPNYFEEYVKWGAQLVFSGHVHGGIMRLPIIGGVLSPSLELFPKYDGGIFRKGQTTMLLGRGMGAHTIPLRFFNPAQLYVVDLEQDV